VWVCVCVCVCDADILLLTTNQIKLVFGVRVITADSSFVLDMGSDPRMERETFLRRLRDSRALVSPWSAVLDYWYWDMGTGDAKAVMFLPTAVSGRLRYSEVNGN